MDVRFKVLANFYISGQSQSRKSYLVRKLLHHLNELFHPVPTKVIYCYPVDVNHGLRWLTVTCDLIDSSKNTDLDGNQSTVLAFLPITPGTRLNSNCYVYERDAYAWRPAKNAIVSEMNF